MKSYLKDAQFLAFGIIPSLESLKIIGDVSSFLDWFNKHYPKENPNNIFEGYKFAIHCCLNTFVGGIESDSIFNFKTSFQFERAISNLVPIHNIDIDCEKANFLYHISTYVKPILKCKDFNSLEKYIAEFHKAITDKFDYIYNNNISVSKKLKIDLQTAFRLNLISFIQTFFLQIGAYGPYANRRNIISSQATTKKRLDVFFEGYKYSIQFLWWNLLGKDAYNKTSLKRIHKATSWKIYKLHKKKKNGDPKNIENIFVEDLRLNLKFQNCLDSYFYRVSNEITNALDEKYKVPLYTIHNYFRIDTQGFNAANLFKHLLKVKVSGFKRIPLSKEDEILEILSWYPYEIIDTNLIDMHLGVPSFNTLLAGSVALFKKRKSEFPKVLVVKCIHPLEKNNDKNNYSFGILIDGISAATENSSGWIIFQDACSNYSGFANHQYQTTQALVDKFVKEKKVEMRELTISLAEFKKFTGSSTLLRQGSFSLFNNSNVIQTLDKARSHSFELFVYSLHLKMLRKTHEVEFNISKKDGEIDVLVYKESDVLLVECKLNPQTCNLDFEINKLLRKADKFGGKKTEIQFWFWNSLSPENEAILKKKSIPYVVVSEKKHPWLAEIDFSSFNTFMKVN